MTVGEGQQANPVAPRSPEINVDGCESSTQHVQSLTLAIWRREAAGNRGVGTRNIQCRRIADFMRSYARSTANSYVTLISSEIKRCLDDHDGVVKEEWRNKLCFTVGCGGLHSSSM